MFDFNRRSEQAAEITMKIDRLLDASIRVEEPRPYLGASMIGDECLRRIQYQWQCPEKTPARTKRIYERGHAMEAVIAAQLQLAGFYMDRGSGRGEFSAVGGMLQGHCDGILFGGPAWMSYPCLWECKCLGSTGWKKIARDGVRAAYPAYFLQVQTYQAYLDLLNPCLFTACNADTCELVHELVDFNPEAAQAASDRAVRVIEATKAGELLPREYPSPDFWRCKMCGHRARCWEIEAVQAA